MALGNVLAVPFSWDGDDMSTYMLCDTMHDYSEVSAVTGNIRNSSTKAQVMRENSSTKGRSRSERRDRRRRQQQGHKLPEPRGLVICGDVDVNDGLKGSIQGVNDTSVRYSLP